MVTVMNEGDRVSVPAWVVDLESFRRWTDSEDVPETSRVWFLRGEVWVDMSKEQAFTHNQVKGELNIGLGSLVKAEDLGLYFPDGMFLTNATAAIAGQPDGMFVAHLTLERGRAQLIPGKRSGFLELEGAPDMVLEIVSDSSVQKDTVDLRRGYWEAGIREYWLVDARQAPLRFDILRRTSRGYTATRAQDGWLRSVVFDREFRLTQTTSPRGYPTFTLDVRERGKPDA